MRKSSLSPFPFPMEKKVLPTSTKGRDNITLFPQYEINRNKRNQDLEKSFQTLISNNINVDKLIAEEGFLSIIHNNKIVWNAIMTVWNKMPVSIKKLTKYILRI